MESLEMEKADVELVSSFINVRHDGIWFNCKAAPEDVFRMICLRLSLSGTFSEQARACFLSYLKEFNRLQGEASGAATRQKTLAYP